MKRIAVAIILAFMAFTTSNAQQRFYLFEDFVKSRIDFTDRSTALVSLNFDALGQKLFYYDGDVLMEMTNMNMIRTLVAGERVFVMKDGRLCEVLDHATGPVLVNWKFKNVNTGNKGALGATTQAKVELLSGYQWDGPYATTYWGKYKEQGLYSQEVWKKKNDNTYYITIKGQEYKVKLLKDLYKAFPEHAAELKAFAKANKLMMVNAEDAFKVFDYLHKLTEQ